MKIVKKIMVCGLLLLLLLTATFATWVYSQIDSALPLLDGQKRLIGLEESVIVERDIQGIPTLKAKNRYDLAIATGFVHAQERFFQMDLLRRNAAGELSSLFGNKALEYDKSIRIHRFRKRAEKIVESLPSDQLQLIKAYTIGVNEGLRLLDASPFEYLLLRQSPVEWQEEDTILSVLSMYLSLQYKDGKRERTLGSLKSFLSESTFNFLNPKGSKWDAAIDGSQFIPSPLPADYLANFSSEIAQQPAARNTDYSNENFPGSNNWAVGGAISKTGSAIVANDMHLNIRVPNTWFRASFEYPSPTNEKHKITGLTLPGTPLIVTGSNGHVAWGFTNSYGDWSDIIILNTNEDLSQYLTPDGYQNFINYKQIVAVKDQDPISLSTKETIWGPVIGKNSAGQLLAYRWVAHDIEAVNLFSQKLEQAKNIEQAIVIANKSGIPAQNIMLGDHHGSIAWTIMGPIPQKSSNFGETPTSWSNGENSWLGYLDTQDYPRVINPKHHRLWTANSRVVGGEMLDILGNGGYAIGARSQQIRDNLFAKDLFDEENLLAIALDDRAVFLERWQNFILKQVLTEDVLIKKPEWQQVKEILKNDRPLSASIDSVAYRFIRNFRINLRDEVFNVLNRQMTNVDPEFDFYTVRHQIETPLWQLINKRPEPLTSKDNAFWETRFEQAFKKTLADMTINQSIVQASWGQQNTTEIHHPISNSVPFLGKWLNMPATQLAGDSYMPRVQGKAFGASQRMVVSPGHEETGILHMPTSQSGHPWSPYFSSGHSDWEQGKPSGFLPQKTKYTLTLLSY